MTDSTCKRCRCPRCCEEREQARRTNEALGTLITWVADGQAIGEHNAVRLLDKLHGS